MLLSPSIGTPVLVYRTSDQASPYPGVVCGIASDSGKFAVGFFDCHGCADRITAIQLKAVDSAAALEDYPYATLMPAPAAPVAPAAAAAPAAPLP